jgi:TolA-binding protein
VVTEKLVNEYEARIKEISAANSLEQVRLRKDLEAANKEIASLKTDKEVLAKRIEDQTAAIIRISDNATRPNTIVNEAVRK